MPEEIRTLVTYATKHGATAEIAEKIGDVLRVAGLPVDVLPARSVGDLTPYAAVVLGSAVYAGQWRKEAVEFLEGNEQQLTERAVWIFSSGPTGPGDPVDLLKGWRLPEAVQGVAERIRPCDIIVFHGVLDEESLNLVEKIIVRGVKAPTGDFRDWGAITNWARAIAFALAHAQQEIREREEPHRTLEPAL